MPKKSRKTRKRKGKKASQSSPKVGAAELLQSFKSAWKARHWPEAMSCYYSWNARTGREPRADLEVELRFRSASFFFQQGRFEEALRHLEKASEKDTDKRRRYAFYTGICRARSGELNEAESGFDRISDEYHREILTILQSRGMKLPRELPRDPAFESGMLLRFWRCLQSGEETESSSTALRNIEKAHHLLASSGNPDPQLKLLSEKPGFEPLALHLKLLASVAARSTQKVRNLLKAHPRSFAALEEPAGNDLCDILDIHLRLLLEEKRYTEVESLSGMFSGLGIGTEALPTAFNEACFHISLKEIDRGNLNSALEYLAKIQKTTPEILHNTALLYQQMGQYDRANEYWTRLLRGEKRPKRADSLEVRRAYSATLKHIARNFLNGDSLEEALPYLKEACKLDEDDREALETLQGVTSDLGRHGEAVIYARRLYEQDPENEYYLFGYLAELMSVSDLDGAVELYRQALEKYPDNPFYTSGLAFCYIQKAWLLRNREEQEARVPAEEAGRLGGSHPRLKYLEGLWLQRKDKPAAADKKFRQALEDVKSHVDEWHLGQAFYQDGMIEHSMELFDRICSCSCSTSDDYAERIVEFLCGQDDPGLIQRMCGLMLKKKGYHLYTIADMLLEHGQPVLAGEYTARLIRTRDADEDDRYLHLLVLNEMGDRSETMSYAQILQESSRQRGDAEDTDFYGYLIKQIKSRGRFKPHNA